MRTPCTTNQPIGKGLAESSPERASGRPLGYLATSLPVMENTWAARDLPVLDAMVKYLDEAAGASFPELRDISGLVELEVVEVGKAALALESAHLIELGKSAGGHGTWYVKQVSGEARRLVGQWPTAEQFVDEVAQRLQDAADEEPDAERRGRLRELASSAGGAARTVFVDVTAAVISRQMGA